ncbi:Uncharacterised protein [uncultured archaeon]|nr:Uncharacterised protein [uncultured archaeon]
MYPLNQEIETLYILPAIRREFAKVLTGKYNLTYEKTGRILGVSKVAISQYLNHKRATLIQFPKDIQKKIEKTAKIIVKDEKKSGSMIKSIIREIKKLGFYKNINKKQIKNNLAIT